MCPLDAKRNQEELLQPGKGAKFHQITDQFCYFCLDPIFFVLQVTSSLKLNGRKLAENEFCQAQVEDQIQALKEELHQRKAGPGKTLETDWNTFGQQFRYKFLLQSHCFAI